MCARAFLRGSVHRFELPKSNQLENLRLVRKKLLDSAFQSLDLGPQVAILRDHVGHLRERLLGSATEPISGDGDQTGKIPFKV